MGRTLSGSVNRAVGVRSDADVSDRFIRTEFQELEIMRRNLATVAVSAFVLAGLAVAGCDESTYVGYFPGGYGYYDEYYYDDGGYWYGDVSYDDGFYDDGWYYDGWYDDDYWDDYYDDLEDYYDDLEDFYDDWFDWDKVKKADLAA